MVRRTVDAGGGACALIVIAGLFLSADPSRPFATFFGDEEFFKNRTMWMRNVSLGVPISRADLIYAYEGVGESSYLFVLAYLQAVVRREPYGVHVMNATVYLVGVLAGYQLIRPVVRIAGRADRPRAAVVLAEPVHVVDLRAEGAGLQPGGDRRAVVRVPDRSGAAAVAASAGDCGRRGRSDRPRRLAAGRHW